MRNELEFCVAIGVRLHLCILEFQKMSYELDDALQKVDEHQMTLDVLEVAHTQERIEGLKKDLEARKEKAAIGKQEWTKLKNVGS